MTGGFAALGSRNFRWFFLARAITMVTGSMSSIALAFAVLQIDNDPVSLSLVLTSFTLANIVFVLFGGVVADRLPRALVIQACYVLDILSIGTIAFLLFTQTATIPVVVGLAAVNGASTAFVLPAMQGIIPQLTTPETLQQANAMLSFVRSLVTIGGPVVAGILVTTVGAAWTMVAQIIGWLAAIPILAMVTLPPPVGDGQFSLFTDLRIGWSEFWSRSWLVAVVLAFMVMNAIHVGSWGVVGPYIAKNDDRLGIAGWGWVVSAEGAGVLLMTLVLMWFPLRRPLRLGMIGISLFALPLTMLGVHPAVVLVAIAAFLAGAGTQVFSTSWSVAMMENIPTEKLSRVSSYDMLGSFIVMPIGTLVYGWLITHADPAVVLTTSGILYAAIAIGTAFVPSVWNMGRAEGAVGRSGAALTAPPANPVRD